MLLNPQIITQFIWSKTRKQFLIESLTSYLWPMETHSTISNPGNLQYGFILTTSCHLTPVRGDPNHSILLAVSTRILKSPPATILKVKMILRSHSNFKIVCSTRHWLKKWRWQIWHLFPYCHSDTQLDYMPTHVQTQTYIYICAQCKYTVYLYVYNCQYLHTDQCCMINPSDIIWIWLCLGNCFFDLLLFNFLNRQKITWATKKTSYFPLYWLFSRDPEDGLLSSLYDWVVLSPIVYPKQPSFFHCSLGGVSNHYLRQFSRCPTFNSRRDTKRRKVSFFWWKEAWQHTVCPRERPHVRILHVYIYIYQLNYNIYIFDINT